jgi:hypothetical protein
MFIGYVGDAYSGSCCIADGKMAGKTGSALVWGFDW